MKKYLYILVSLISQHIIAQQACQPGVAESYYSTGKIAQNLSTSGALFTNGSGEPGYNYLIDGKPVSLIYAGGIWMGGLDSVGTAYFSGTTYVSSNNQSDWTPGLIYKAEGVSDEENCKNWDRFFTITREEILATIALMHNSNGTINYDNCDKLPLSVLSWPGTYNPRFKAIAGFELPHFTLAPFYDHDTDGIYDPCRGDIPIFQPYRLEIESVEEIIATFPDRLSLNVFNDNHTSRPLSSGEPVNVGIYQFAFDYHTQDSLETSTFYQHKVISYNPKTLHHVRFSHWFDPDLGCYLDDYIGTSSEHNMVYFYNTDAEDGSPGDYCNETPTFGTEIPMVGVSFLDGLDYIDFQANPQGWSRSGLTSSIYLNNCSLGGVEPATCDPIGQDSNFYVKMTGKWNSNIPITVGGNGLNPASTDTTRFVFDSNPADAFGWNMCNANLPPSDFRMLMSTGDATLITGSIDDVITVIQTAPNVNHPCPDIQPLIELNKAAHNFKNRGWRRKTTISSTTPAIEEPMPWSFTANETGFKLTALDSPIQVTISDVVGRIVDQFQIYKSESKEWIAQNNNTALHFVQISTNKTSHTYKVIVR